MIVIFTGFAQVADVTLGSWIRGEAQHRVLTNSTLLIYIVTYWIFLGNMAFAPCSVSIVT
jgi:hypothetical protein